MVGPAGRRISACGRMEQEAPVLVSTEIVDYFLSVIFCGGMCFAQSSQKPIPTGGFDHEGYF